MLSTRFLETRPYRVTSPMSGKTWPTRVCMLWRSAFEPGHHSNTGLVCSRIGNTKLILILSSRYYFVRERFTSPRPLLQSRFPDVIMHFWTSPIPHRRSHFPGRISVPDKQPQSILTDSTTTLKPCPPLPMLSYFSSCGASPANTRSTPGASRRGSRSGRGPAPCARIP